MQEVGPVLPCPVLLVNKALGAKGRLLALCHLGFKGPPTCERVVGGAEQGLSAMLCVQEAFLPCPFWLALVLRE